MKLNAVDWGKVFGNAVDSYGQYKVISEQKKAIEAQRKAEQEAAMFRMPAFLTGGETGASIPKEYLLIGGALILVLLIGGRK